MDHRDRGIGIERKRSDEILEMAGFDAAAGEADDLSIASENPSRERAVGSFAAERLSDRRSSAANEPTALPTVD